jgi:hypothetical protein
MKKITHPAICASEIRIAAMNLALVRGATLHFFRKVNNAIPSASGAVIIVKKTVIIGSVLTNKASESYRYTVELGGKLRKAASAGTLPVLAASRHAGHRSSPSQVTLQNWHRNRPQRLHATAATRSA